MNNKIKLKDLLEITTGSERVELRTSDGIPKVIRRALAKDMFTWSDIDKYTVYGVEVMDNFILLLWVEEKKARIEEAGMLQATAGLKELQEPSIHIDNLYITVNHFDDKVKRIAEESETAGKKF